MSSSERRHPHYELNDFALTTGASLDPQKGPSKTWTEITSRKKKYHGHLGRDPESKMAHLLDLPIDGVTVVKTVQVTSEPAEESKLPFGYSHS